MGIGEALGKLILGLVSNLFFPFLKLVFKTLVFTGLWLTAAIVLGVDWGLKTLFHFRMATNHSVENMIIIIALIPVVFITCQSAIRLFSGNPKFSIMGTIFGSSASKAERKAINPSINNELSVTHPSGFIFGKKAGKYIIKPENVDGHIIVIGGAGSGKSSCIAIPSLLSWKERVFAIDIKGELSKKTAKRRPNMKVFNPADPKHSVGYDPFYLLHHSTNLVQDVKEIALAIIPLPETVSDPFWIKGAQNLFTGGMLYFYNKDYSFIETIKLIQSTPVLELVKEISEGSCQDAKLFCNQFVGLDIKTVSGIFSEVSNNILLFATDPQLREALSRDDIISPIDIENGFDVYISIEESKLEQWKGLLTLIVNQFLKHFERRAEEGAIPVLFLLDEFARLGKIETVINGLATLRSKKVTICILTQSLAQLDSIYGKPQRQVIADNCQYKAILNATDADTQEYFSKLVGTYDKSKKSHNANFDQYTGLGKGTGSSLTTEEKRIIKPEEFATMKDVVLLSPIGFFRVEKAPYYKDEIFKSQV